ncbi:MAG: PilZ domain-containing protein [Oligoflexia bacterium]|nr:PilZ domain-containing protein [Oligoflexia bacterium]
MSESRWIFVNRKNSGETIIVSDLESARALSRLLKSFGTSDWIVRQEASLDELYSAPTEAARVAPLPEAAPEPKLQQPVVEPAMPIPPPVYAPAPAKPVAPQSAPSAPIPPQPSFVAEPVGGAEAPDLSGPPMAEGVPPPFYMTERKSGNRRYQRYNVEFRVILVSGSRSFRTFSSNVSVGGMLLRQKVPVPMLNQICRVFIGSTTSNENIELSCKVIGDPTNPRRLTFGECDPASLKRLENWIMHAASATKAA